MRSLPVWRISNIKSLNPMAASQTIRDNINIIGAGFR